MMFLWSTIIATLLGLASAVVLPRDDGFYTLNQSRVDSTNVYAHYASAVKCAPQSLTHWNCGGAYYLSCVPFFSCGRKAWGANGGDGSKVQFCAPVNQAVDFLSVVICMLTLSNRDGGLR